MKRTARLFDTASKMCQKDLPFRFVWDSLRASFKHDAYGDIFLMWGENPKEDDEVIITLVELLFDLSTERVECIPLESLDCKKFDKLMEESLASKARLFKEVEKSGGLSLLESRSGLPMAYLIRFFDSASEDREAMLRIQKALDHSDGEKL